MARLDEHLERLEAEVTARGGTVHWARDAAEANEIVAGLVRDAGATEVVKVKSLATDEIGLNDALAAHGIAAYETDLAELIVQLGADRPSHILVPAIHRNRAEIREIFLREMGDVDPGLTDDPAALAEAARLHLRRKFLSAQVGISGANFAIAETRTLCVVESEGNGRMCLTLPRILITVMGIEKLLPTWSDLEVFLQLLPRSRTGERMNPYTPMWTGVTPGDGPQELHLVLLDNGRTAALASGTGRARLALHPVLGLPERVPGVRADRRYAYGRLPGPDRRGTVPAADRGGVQRDPAVCVVLVRRLLRRLPGTHRHPVDPGGAARPVVDAEAAEHRAPSSEAVLMRSTSVGDGRRRRWPLALRALNWLARWADCSAGSRAHLVAAAPAVRPGPSARDAPVPPAADLPRAVGQERAAL